MEKLIVNILSFGAKPNTDELQTEYIQAAIDHCAELGGGEVQIPEGEFISGDIRLRSNITLHLLKNAKLLGSLNPKDYLHIFDDTKEPIPEKTMYHWIPVHMRNCEQANHHLDTAGSYWNYGLIRAINAENIAIIGEEGSLLDGRNCYDEEGENHFRGPHCINMHYCKNLTFSGYTIMHSANWAHAIFSCENLKFDNVTVLAGHDGIHVRKCDNVDIKNCVLKTGDDCLAGFDNYNVHITDTTFNSACSAMRFGGQNILVENCLFYGPCEYVFRGGIGTEGLKNNANSGGNARKNMLSVYTYFIDGSIQIRRQPKNIVIRNCTVHNSDRFFHLNLSGNEAWQKGFPPEDVTFENIKADGISKGTNAYGDGSVPFVLTMKDIDFSFREGAQDVPFIKAGNYGKIILDNVKISNTDAPIIEKYTEGEIEINNLTCDLPKEKICVTATEAFSTASI